MRKATNGHVVAVLVAVLGVGLAMPAFAQLGNSGSIDGVIKDPTGVPLAKATVDISHPVSGYNRSATTATDGSFRFANVPFNPYHLVVTAPAFEPYVQDLDVRSAVPVSLQVTLQIATVKTNVTVTSKAEDLVENDPSFHTDIDRGLFDKLPLESQSSSVSSLVTLSSPGVVADSNGLFHGLGDHAENSFSVDGQPINDQQSKVFSNQIPIESIQSLEVIAGAPTAEFGDKTSLIIKVTTRSGLGQTQPQGSVKASYGTFGSANGSFDMAVGGENWGNFIAVSGLNTDRFLDPPELQATHDNGNEQNLFDRVDYQVSRADTIHLNVSYTRSSFETPNTYDSLNVGLTDAEGNPVGPAQQSSLIKTINLAPSWTRLLSDKSLLNVGAFFRQDQYKYDGSPNALADQPETVNQYRTLANSGVHADFSYVSGPNNFKAGASFGRTALHENFNFGITAPTVNAPCLNPDGSPDGNTSFVDPSQCSGALQPNPAYLAILRPIDLTRGGSLYTFDEQRNIDQSAFFAQDTLTEGALTLNLGLRADLYRGIVSDTELEPRLGASYNIKATNTILRLSYARIQETPFNENLILGSLGSTDPVINAVFNGPGSQPFAPIEPGHRNQFDAGFAQAFGRFLAVEADYMWKYTRNGYDFSVLGNTPITFPIAWHNSKLDGLSGRVSMPNYKGLSAFVVVGHVNSRFFPPQIGGLGATEQGGSVFRIDHDQKFQQTTHLQYQPVKDLPWVSLNWRYDNGLVAGSVPDVASAFALDGDEQAAIGLYCGSQFATLQHPLTGCPQGVAAGATRVVIPPAGTENDDTNPPRIAPRHLFDVSVGDDNLFRSARYKWSLRFAVINLTNKIALYNFLSTFSGTHFVSPRAFTAELGFHF